MSEVSIEESLARTPAEEYVGHAVVSTAEVSRLAGARTSTTADGEIAVEVRLRGHFEPLDGRFHWYGRIAANPELADSVQSGATVVLETPHGRAQAWLADVDPWGRFRVSGTGRPPF